MISWEDYRAFLELIHPALVDRGFWIVLAANAAVLALLGGAAWFAAAAIPREPWRTAWRQLKGRRWAMASLAVLLAYAAVGLLDTVCWRDPLRDESGQVRRDMKGEVQLDPVPLTLLDRICTPLRKGTEKTYAAPLARVQFSKDLVQDEQGRSRWVTPALKHPTVTLFGEAFPRHLFGTDKVGQDVFYQALKGVRTALLIGGLTLLIAIPCAVAFGVLAGYFGGWVDELIQYVYSTLASIPGILLISALVLLWGRGLTQLCVILGIMSWTSLCRLVRAETLKLRELEYVQAADIFGVSRLRILRRHVVPNLLHLVTISAVLQFSGLVLAEAVLAYVGVGVEAGTGSWGNMINTARLELSRDPVVWWNLAAAFVFYVGLVLPAVLFGDELRDALDPRLRTR